ncbi:hypothetical protein [Clostridium sp. Marseille-QA1073]
MSSENKTPNLELNQWNGNEYPKRTDFIEDNKKIDEAYKELKDSIKDGGKVSSVNSKIGDVILKAEDIKTVAGITVENKLNELFQFADNGKKNIATVIGSPLSSSDTFDSMKSKIQTMKSAFASNLTAKGQSSSGSDTLNNLINKIPNINIGKKWASGRIEKNQTINLTFSPKYIVLAYYMNETEYNYYSIESYLYGFFPFCIKSSGKVNIGSGGESSVMGSNDLTVSGNSFSIKINTGSWHNPIYSYLALE